MDEFADLLGLRDWYEWKPDPGHHDIAKAPHEGVSNAPLLNEKHSAAVWFLVNALQRYAKLSTEAVREITFEIGRLGERGLDYANPAAQYQLESLPGEHFSGLQLLCLMFAGFQRFAPEVDCGIDFHAPFLTALELFQQQHPNEDSSP